MSNPDLNLLIAFDVLLDECSVTRAAERLHLSPPAMSRALARIRELVDDPILVRSGRHLVPTPRALELRNSVKAAVEMAQQVFTPKQLTDPALLQRVFHIRTNDFSFGEIARQLVVQLSKQAPHSSLCIVPEGVVDDHALAEGRIDLYITSKREFSPDTKQQKLFDTSFVGIACANHPLFAQAITAERFASYGHISVSRRGRSRGPVDQQLQTLGLKRHVAVISPSLFSALFYLPGSDLILPTMPRNMLMTVERLGLPLRTFELPVEVNPIEIMQVWHPRFDNDPAHQWFRRLVKTVCLSHVEKNS
ncbi:LysR family transcriptional regulator [Shewanella sp. C32]|uniref:LysR family transcriptional regulator n=1 Tax=Shewanella electrica TaxID=515560 RepID=A0ABT2FIF9_9GAMM|nr:LysR family transcriptional regulator [Shewanella electrica]MCH1924219.1 LysR family transcriptional regulator [Shewanella electrica]MCS4556122.1 LysR family transcriptional regulator [Shewanella electrica]